MGSCVSDFIHKVMRLYIFNDLVSGVVKHMVLFNFLRMLGKGLGARVENAFKACQRHR